MTSLERYEARIHAQDKTPPAASPRLAGLIDEHNDLDLVISVLLSAGSSDDLLVSRLKKRKLHIKDEIACLRGQAQPLSSVA